MDRASADKSGQSPAPSAAEKRALRSRANRIKASLAAGRGGLAQPFIDQVRLAFENADLLKIRLSTDTASESDEMAAALAERVPCHLVSRVGRVVVLYRPLPEKDHE